MGRLKNFDRNVVLEAAIQLFWKKGYAETSLTDLEKATGVNKSGLYSEFKDKDDIFLESLKHYSQIHPVVEILNTQPLGWNNIENFFKSSMTCRGQKGCFMANSLREHSILPIKVRQLMEHNSSLVYELLLKNVIATGTKKDPQMLTKMISTFSVGMSLKLNVIKPELLNDQMISFLEMCKNS